MKIDIRRPRIDPTARSVDERIHGRKDLVNLDDEAGLFLKDFDQLTSFGVDHFRLHLGDGQDYPIAGPDEVHLWKRSVGVHSSSLFIQQLL